MAVAVKTMDKPAKHPLARLDYDLDIAEWLEVGETITSITVTVEPTTDLTVEAPLNYTPIVKVWVEDGTGGINYTLTFRCPTSAGREYVAQMVIPVRD